MGAADLIELIITIITSVLTGLPTALVTGFESLVSNAEGNGFSLLAIWVIVLMCLGIGLRLVFSLINKVRS